MGWGRTLHFLFFVLAFTYLPRPLETFHSGEEAEPVIVVPILAKGREALVAVSSAKFTRPSHRSDKTGTI